MELERGQRLEYGCPLRRVCCQADGLAYASEVELSGMGSVRNMRKQESHEFIRGSVNLPSSYPSRLAETLSQSVEVGVEAQDPFNAMPLHER